MRPRHRKNCWRFFLMKAREPEGVRRLIDRKGAFPYHSAMRRTILSGAACWMVGAGLVCAGPLEVIQGYSGIRRVDPERLGSGQIEGARIPAAGGELSISTETLFAVPLPPARVVDLMKDTVSATHAQASETLDVELHLPISTPAKESDFARLNLGADPAARWLLSAGARGTGAGLNLNAVEADRLAKAGTPETAEKAWRELLAARARLFQERGWVAAPPYDLGNRAFNQHQEMVRLLKTMPTILNHFKDTIGATMTARLAAGMDEPKYYWEASKIQGDRTITLAAVFAREVGPGHWQVAEPTYYVSAKYFTSLILYDVHAYDLPGGGKGSVVWRGDFVITPSIGVAKGIERMAAENITLLEVRKSVRAFVDECRAVAGL